ncbi:hypothetical protein K491DRAFT_224289 [Lophiostoma macrostomum CBS 122681]|uniref:Uncharacterized protein n=1 Tax=Lophiostoma macrostomum CBS 122681 TaxID=1314788 RepID=A0A6A6TGG3_9PLEO|nr:hypothetical protein K491DRAFT_224289 [Lophiostoma macrostomum CBS 122681]
MAWSLFTIHERDHTRAPCHRPGSGVAPYPSRVDNWSPPAGAAAALSSEPVNMSAVGLPTGLGRCQTAIVRRIHLRLGAILYCPHRFVRDDVSRVLRRAFTMPFHRQRPAHCQHEFSTPTSTSFRADRSTSSRTDRSPPFPILRRQTDSQVVSSSSIIRLHGSTPYKRRLERARHTHRTESYTCPRPWKSYCYNDMENYTSRASSAVGSEDAPPQSLSHQASQEPWLDNGQMFADPEEGGYFNEGIYALENNAIDSFTQSTDSLETTEMVDTTASGMVTNSPETTSNIDEVTMAKNLEEGTLVSSEEWDVNRLKMDRVLVSDTAMYLDDVATRAFSVVHSNIDEFDLDGTNFESTGTAGMSMTALVGGDKHSQAPWDPSSPYQEPGFGYSSYSGGSSWVDRHPGGLGSLPPSRESALYDQEPSPSRAFNTMDEAMEKYGKASPPQTISPALMHLRSDTKDPSRYHRIEPKGVLPMQREDTEAARANDKLKEIGTTCPYCRRWISGDDIDSRANLWRHKTYSCERYRRATNSEKRSSKCPRCERKYARPDILTRHLKRCR